MATTFKSLVDYPNGSSALASNISSAVESIVLATDPGSAFPATNFWVRIGYEQILVASRTAATLTCTGGRGANGTSAAAHSAGDTVTVDLFKAHIEAVQTAVNTLEITGAVTALAVTNNATVGGTLQVTGASTLASLACTAAGTFGGGYGSTGCTIATTGNIQTNGTLTVDGAQTLTGVTTHGAGSVSTPAVNLSDAGTGLYRSAANELAVTCNGAQVLKVAAGAATITGTATIQTLNGSVAVAPTVTVSAITNSASYAPGFAALRARDTAGDGVKVATQDGDTIVNFGGAGYNGSGFDSAASIAIKQDGAVAGTNVPGRLEFSTAPNSGGLTTRLTIYSDGKAGFSGPVGFNGTAPVAKPTVTGSRGSNAALASLLTTLANLGLLTDSSS